MSVPAPTRRLPRFSLITLIVMVNFAGVLLWANTRLVISDDSVSRRVLPGDMIHATSHQAGMVKGSWSRERGWPFIYYYETNVGFGDYNPPPSPGEIHWRAVIVNIVIGVFLVAAAGELTEIIVRKLRKAKPHGE